MNTETSSPVNIFSRYKTNSQLKAAVALGTVRNIDYKNYKTYRAVTKACALKHFPKFFEERGDKQNFILKNKIACSINAQGRITFEQKDDDKESVALANKIKPFLDSLLTFELEGNVRETEALPVVHLQNPYKKYFLSSRLNTLAALVKRYEEEYKVSPDLKHFTCPLSGSVALEHKNDVQIEHIEDEANIFQKLLAAVYILNKLKPADEKVAMPSKFYSLTLEFNKNIATNPHLKPSKQFLFAKKSLAVNLLSDTRNLVFLCKPCNTSKPKEGGWSVAMASNLFQNIVSDQLKQDMKAEEKKAAGEKAIIDFQLTKRFQSDVITRFTKNIATRQQLISARKYLDALANSQGITLNVLMDQITALEL